MPRSLKLQRKIKATPEEVYIALTNPFTIELWSGEPAIMSQLPGSEFSILGGAITGRNLEFTPDQMLRQRWDFEDEESESIVIIRLIPDKKNTLLQVEQSGIPDSAYENMVRGWKSSYLQALQDFFEA